MSSGSEAEQWTRDVARFKSKVKVVKSVDACEFGGRYYLHWIWVGGRGGTGYGSFRIGHQSLTAHGAAWRLGGNEVLPGERLRHSCGVMGCVRPSHWRDYLNRPGVDPW